MGDQANENGASKPNKTGDGVGGADTSGSGNILGGVQPKEGEDEEGEERRDG